MSTTAMDDRGIIVSCAQCGQKNRVPFGRAAKCGKCGAELNGPAEPVEVPSVQAFDSLIQDSNLPVVVDFWAPWCGPCRMVAPEIARVAASHAGRWIVAKVNTDVLTELGERYRVMSIPTMAVFKGGREVGRTSGARPADQIEEFVRQSI